MTNLSDISPKALPEIEIREDGSTMERFVSLTRRLLSASREDVAKAEAAFKADQMAKKAEWGISKKTMIVILAIGLSLSTSQAVAADFSVIGVGENSCGKWTENKKSNEIYYEMQQTWVLGFASGVGSTHLKGMDPLAGLDAYAVAGWVDNYCRRNPLNNIATAAIEFIKIHPH